MTDHLIVLREREKYLRGRIRAKSEVGWETQWDERERAALEWALTKLSTEGFNTVEFSPVKFPIHLMAMARAVYEARGYPYLKDILWQMAGEPRVTALRPDQYEQFCIRCLQALR